MFDIVLLCIAYLLGSIPSGLLLARWANLGDIRQHGSGNIGATNALRLGGKKLGALTLLCDVLKGCLALHIIFIAAPQILALAAVIVVLGHIFPIWLQFKGGKGVATALGVSFYCTPCIACWQLLIWILVFYQWRFASLASILSAVLGVVLVAYMQPDWLISYLIISVLIILKHRDNIVRIYRGVENKI